MTEKTLRDEIAIEAMKDFIINDSVFKTIVNSAQREGVAPHDTLAVISYYLADQMMKARDVKE